MAGGNFKAKMILSQNSIIDLNWCVFSLPIAYRTIDHGVPNIVIVTDALCIGWGAVAGTNHTQGL